MSFSSLLMRLSVVLAGFYFVMAGRWERLACAMAGFIIAREVIKKLIGRSAPAKG